MTVDTGDAGKNRAYDRDPATQWSSVGSSDTTTETYTVIFNANKTFNRVSLMNHNLKDYYIQYWVDPLWEDFDPPIQITGGTNTDDLFEVAEVTTTRIGLKATKTHVVDDEKRVGEFLAYREYFDIPEDELPDNEDFDLHFREFEHELSDGGSVLVTEVTTGKYRNVFSFNNLAKTYRDNLETLKELHLSFWFIPDDDPSEQYFCNMTNYKFDKILAWTTSGDRAYTGYIEVKET